MRNVIDIGSVCARPGERHPVTNALISACRDLKPGQVITDLELQTIARGVDRKIWMGYMQTVKSVLLLERKIWLHREPRIGYRHLTDADVVAMGEKESRRARRSLGRTVRRLREGLKNFEALTPAERQEYVTRLAQLSTMHHLTERTVTRALREESSNTKQISIGNTLALAAEYNARKRN